MDQRGGVDELDGDRGAHDARVAPGSRAGGDDHQQRPQALAARGDRRAGVLGEHRAVGRGDHREPLLHARHRARDVGAARLDHRRDGLGARHQAPVPFVPTWRAMMPPAVRIQRTSTSPAAAITAASRSGAGKRLTDFGRYV